jgi:ABC transport system ATP-binding/permease protein
MAPPLLLLQDLSLTFGATPLLAGAELSVGPGERLCVVGRNGCGKSTLLRVAAGLQPFDSGSRFLQPGTTVRYLPQEPDLSGFDTTEAYVAAGLGPGDDSHRARSVLEALGLTGREHPARLSGGEARRTALARALAPAPDILLLDEPTNHLDLPAIAWLEAELASLRAALVMVSHDRRLLELLSGAVVWIDRGATRRLDRGFAHFEAWRDETLEQEARDHHKLARKIVVEEDWLRYGVTARRKRNVRRLANLHALRARHRAAQAPLGTAKLEAAEAETSGRMIIEAKGLEKSFDGRPIVRHFSTKILRGDRLALVGPNGAGKTTLLNLLTGQLAPDAGTVRLGAGLEMVVLDQRRDSLDPAATLADTLTGGHGETVWVNRKARHVMAYMKDFLFSPGQARTPVGSLSGGERGRVALAVALARPSNLLVLDEPTNDLDLETLDLLQEMLGDYAGTVLLVSHDRDFLDRVATSVVNAEGDGSWVDYAGGFSDMLAQGGRVLGTAPAVPPMRAKAAPRKESPAAPPRKLTFRDQHALATLPGRIEELQAEVVRWQARLADPDLYARDPASFARASQGFEKATQALAAAEERWLELELLREEIEQR